MGIINCVKLLETAGESRQENLLKIVPTEIKELLSYFTDTIILFFFFFK